MRLLQFVIFLGLISCTHPESIEYQRHPTNHTSSVTEFKEFENKDAYRVIGIKDGDTFVLLMDGKEQTIRLAHIDCPERRQPFGTKAKQLASDLCFGKIVEIKIQGKPDRNGRLIAEIITEDNINVNKELVKNGLAWHYKKYSDSEEYAQLELDARNNRTGIWSESNPITPWDWRKSKR